MPWSTRFPVGALVIAAVIASACDQTDSPTAPEQDEVHLAEAPLPTVTPAPLVTVSTTDASLEFWPYTGQDLTGVPADPINLVFPGVDALSIRAALLMLDGDRTAFGFPAGFPFDCTWQEAMAANQTAYVTGPGWTGSAIQLECGEYGPVRFHLRLFPSGDWTLGNAHFEVQIPGTNEHEVLSWELAEQLVAVDLVRAGVLGAAPTSTDPITPLPTYRAINPLVYNALPDELKAITGGPPTANEPVPLGNDGRATILPFAGPVQGERMVSHRSFVLEFDQVIPKPFCMSGPADFLKVEGPIDFTQRVVVTPNGGYRSHFMARGRLELAAFDPVAGQVVGPMMQARVMEQHRSALTDNVSLVTSLRMQFILPGRHGGGERLHGTLRVGPGGADGATLEITCDD